MSQWSSAKAKRVLAALLRIGGISSVNPVLTGSFPTGWPDVVFAFHDRDGDWAEDAGWYGHAHRAEPKDL